MKRNNWPNLSACAALAVCVLGSPVLAGTPANMRPGNTEAVGLVKNETTLGKVNIQVGAQSVAGVQIGNKEAVGLGKVNIQVGAQSVAGMQILDASVNT